jgi:hypothetical protein
MWKCLNCEEQVDDDFEVCWNCQTAQDGSLPDAYFHQKVVPRELVPLQERMSRQTDEDLLRIVSFDAIDYRPEAIDLARVELSKRGIVQSSRVDAENESRPEVPDSTNEPVDEAVEHLGELVGMRARVFRILTLLKDQNVVGLKHFREEDDSSFEIKTPYAERGHQTFLKYETKDDGNAIRMELTHVFGRLDFDEGINPAQLLHLLSMNVPSFRNSSAYVGARSIDGSFFVSLNATLVFLTKWSNEDIAAALAIHLCDLVQMGFLLEMPPPIEQFGVGQTN